jgi:hypothetical protein
MLHVSELNLPQESVIGTLYEAGFAVCTQVIALQNFLYMKLLPA